MKNTNYCIIDHIGTVENIQEVYNLAYSLCTTEKDKVYTMKKFCQMINKSPNEVSNKQKNFVRFNKHPQEVIFICNNFNTTNQWLADVWAEKVQTLTVIEAETMEVYTMKDLHPDWFSEKYITENTIYRRCAQIWGKALGWNFSAPLFRDNNLNTTESFIRNKTVAAQVKNKDDLSKIATRPDSYLKTKAVASEEECKEFFKHYKYLQQNNLLKDCLEAGYTLCPTCGRPIYETAQDCDYCNFHREIEADFETYFEADYYEDWD